MERWATDALAVCCILAGAAGGVAVTLAALDRDDPAVEVSCAVGTHPAGLSVIVGGDGRSSATIVAHGLPCARTDDAELRPVLVQLRKAEAARLRGQAGRMRAELMRARAEEMRARAEAGRQALDVEREVLRQLERELSARARQLEGQGRR